MNTHLIELWLDREKGAPGVVYEAEIANPCWRKVCHTSDIPFGWSVSGSVRVTPSKYPMTQMFNLLRGKKKKTNEIVSAGDEARRQEMEWAEAQSSRFRIRWV